MHLKTSSMWLDRLYINALELIANGYYRRHERQIKTPSLLKQLNEFTLIAEIKPASPSEGSFNNLTRDRIEEIFSEASALSVLTEPTFFEGSLEDLYHACSYGKPVLMKDIIIHESQIQENCSAILLIYKLLDEERIHELIKHAHSKGVEVLLEVDNEADFSNALKLPADILGVNNRNLDTMQIDTSMAERILVESTTDKPVVALSGYSSREEIQTVQESGASGVVIGSVLSRSKNPSLKLRELAP